MSSSFAKIHLRRLGLTSTPGGFPRRMEPGQRLNPSVEQAAQAMMSLNILLTENGRLRFHDLTCVFGDFAALAQQLASPPRMRAPTPMDTLPRQESIGSVDAGP